MVSGFLLDVPHSNFVAHENIQVYPQNNPTSLNQTWTIVSSLDDVPVPAGYCNIFAGDEPANNLCIDIPHSDTASGTLVQLYPIDKPGGATNQQWKLVPYVEGQNLMYIVSAFNDNLVLDVRGGKGQAHALIQIYEKGDGKPNQLWILNPA
jgi:hypothetical protein